MLTFTECRKGSGELEVNNVKMIYSQHNTENIFGIFVTLTFDLYIIIHCFILFLQMLTVKPINKQAISQIATFDSLCGVDNFSKTRVVRHARHFHVSWSIGHKNKNKIVQT